MPRHSRLDIAGHLYHVLSRGIEQRKIFLEEGDYAEFRALWKEAGICLNKGNV